MQRIRGLVGLERSLTEVSQTLCFAIRELSADEVGGMLVRCADESEDEVVAAFQHGFVHYLLPQLKFARRSAFRIANLGGRYEWGAVRIAEQHFATPATENGFKALAVKINAHVAYEELRDPWHSSAESPRFRLGTWKRYDTESACCGALGAVLGGSPEPFSSDLREAFVSEGRDRIAALKDPQRVDPLYRSLYAAIVSARLQARKAVLDIQDYRATTPTHYFVLPCVTINKHERDTEIVCGLYEVDARQGRTDAVYSGLGDDPAAYEISIRNRQFIVTDEHVGSQRKGRDHRAMAREEFKRRFEEKRAALRDDRLDRIHTDVAQNKHRNHHHARMLLRTALPILAEVAPVPAAILMFAEGAAGIHHAFRIHQLSRDMADTAEARLILDEMHSRIDGLEPDRAEALVELLMREYRP